MRLNQACRVAEFNVSTSEISNLKSIIYRCFVVLYTINIKCLLFNLILTKLCFGLGKLTQPSSVGLLWTSLSLSDPWDSPPLLPLSLLCHWWPLAALCTTYSAPGLTARPLWSNGGLVPTCTGGGISWGKMCNLSPCLSFFILLLVSPSHTHVHTAPLPAYCKI